MSAPAFIGLNPERGYLILYRQEERNACPGCGKSNWLIGRVSAECAFCGTAIPLAQSSSAPPALLEMPALPETETEN
jgi:hypothetical protein